MKIVVGKGLVSTLNWPSPVTNSSEGFAIRPLSPTLTCHHNPLPLRSPPGRTGTPPSDKVSPEAWLRCDVRGRASPTQLPAT